MNDALAISSRLNSSAEQLIDATAALLGERTLMDVTLSEIAKRSGLNGAMIKYYFGNKEGLLLAVLRRDAAVAMTALAKLVDMPISASEKLRIHISGIINAYHRSPYLNRLIHHMADAAGPSASLEVIRIFIEPMLAAYSAIITQGIEEGTFRPIDPALLYYSLVGACEHLFHAAYSVESTLGTRGITAELKQRYAAHVTEMCMNGLIRTDQSPSTD